MNKDVILSRAGEQLEECTVLYAVQQGNDPYRVYFDKEGTRCLTASELKEAFVKRCIVYVSDKIILVPIAFSINGDGSAAVTFYFGGTQMSAYSAEYVKP